MNEHDMGEGGTRTRTQIHIERLKVPILSLFGGSLVAFPDQRRNDYKSTNRGKNIRIVSAPSPPLSASTADIHLM